MGEGVTNAALQETEQTFDQTLRALLDGGTAPYLSDTTVTLPLTRDPQIRSALNRVALTWSDFLERLPRPARYVAANSARRPAPAGGAVAPLECHPRRPAA
jgi:hypothetical protein